MPNQCNNVLEIHSKKKDIIEGIKAHTENLLNWIKPMPEELFAKFSKEEKEEMEKKYGTASRYTRRLDNRGCKRDVDIEISEEGNDFIILDFDSPRCSPKEAILELSKKFPEAEIELSYDEPGEYFSGTYSFKGGEVVDYEEFNDPYYGQGVKCKKCDELYDQQDINLEGICYECLEE